jgi:hypothetical protein
VIASSQDIQTSCPVISAPDQGFPSPLAGEGQREG